MPGITSLLNIAKSGLLTHQLNLQTTGHNVSNVNTRGYSRQSVDLSSQMPTPAAIGQLGNGVSAKEVTRNYDSFITQVLFEKSSIKSGLETRQSGMKLIEGILNETDENGLNELLSQFWSAWEDIANNAESMPERTTLLQRATLLANGIREKYKSLVKQSQDIDVNLETTIGDINRLSKQIARINVQIVAAETGGHSANDLRDQRDMLVREMSNLADIHYFETERGSYTILIGQGSPLVEGDRSWELQLRSGQVEWIGTDGKTFTLTPEDVEGGELGGWLDIKSRITPSDPAVLIGSLPNATGGKGMKPGTHWDALDGVTVTGDFSISFSGTDQDGKPVNGTFTYSAGPPESNATIGDFLDSIAQMYQDNTTNPPLDRVEVSVTEDGRIKIHDIKSGTRAIKFQIDSISGAVTGLNFGKFDTTYPLNYVETLNKFATQLIKSVNNIHAKGIGLVPLSETTSINMVANISEPLAHGSSGLEFADDIKDGAFKIWLFDADGQAIDSNPATSYVEPYTIQAFKDDGSGGRISQSLEEIRQQIDNIDGISAKIVNNRLNIGIDGTTNARSFSFGKDDSSLLMALGLNSFFSGHDAATIHINQDVMDDPKLIAAAQVREAPISIASASKSIIEPERALDISLADGTITVQMQDNMGNSHSYQVYMDIDRDSLENVLDALRATGKIAADIVDGKVKLSAKENGWTITSIDGGGTNLLSYLGIQTPAAPVQEISGDYLVERTFDPVANYNNANLSFPGQITFDLYDSTGTAQQFSVDAAAGDSLKDIAEKLDNLDGLSVQLVDGKLRIEIEGGYTGLALRQDDTGITEFLGLDIKGGGSHDPANNSNALEITRLSRQGMADLDGASLNEAFHSLVATVGIHARGINQDLDFTTASVMELEARRDSVAGVSLDEELSNLLKFQHAYTAAAKLIKTADEMFLTLLETK